MHRFYIAVVLGACLFRTVHAAGLTDVSPIPGYSCAQLALTGEQAMDPKIGIPIRDTPSQQAPAVSYASSIVLVQEPARPTAGFVQVLRFTGQTGWIEAKWLRPWFNKFDPMARCVPSMMSNGKPGFGFTH